MKTCLLLMIVSLGVFESAAQLTIDDSRLRSIINKNLDLFEKEKVFPSRENLFKKSQLLLNIKLNSEKTLKTGYESQVKGTLVLVRAYKSRILPDWQISIGAAFLISKNMVLTNFHLVDPKKRGVVFMLVDFDGNCYPVKKVRKLSKENDLAVLECDAQGLNALKFSEENETGRDVSVVSHPDGSFYSYSKGYVTRHFFDSVEGEKKHRMSISAEFAKGSSGSPILNSKGEVIGIVSLTRSTYYNKENGIDKNLQMVERVCIPTQVILDFLKD